MGEEPIPDIDPQTLARSRVIAKGNRIRDMQKLVDTYGGYAGQWVKKSGPIFAIGRSFYEFHWYEHPGIGRVEIRRKKVGDK